MSDSSDRRVVLSRQELQAILTGLSKNPQRLLALPEVRAAVARHRFDRLKSERGLEFSPFEEDDLRTGAVQHNVDGLNALPALDRTAELVQPLLSLNIVKANINSLRVLSIGPRSEIELLALHGWGFHPNHIEAVDLMSYSPLVQAGDMHALPFEDDQFDIVILGWVLPYSRNVPKAVEEVARVARNGAVICVGWNYSLADRDIQRSVDSPRPHMVDSEAVAIHGPESIEAHFGDWVGEVLFRNRARQPFDAVYIRNMTIFRMFKNPATVAIADTWRDEEALAARVTAQMGPKYTDVENPVHRLLHTFFAAYEKSSRSRTTSDWAYQAMRQCYFQMKGRLDDAVCRMLAGSFPPVFLPMQPATFESALGVWTHAKIEEAGLELRERGIYVLPERLPAETVQALREAMEGVETVDDHGNPCGPYAFDASSGPRRLKFSEEGLLQSEVVRQLWMDPVLVALAEQALGCMPVLDFVHGLASRPGSDSMDERDRAAQHFHSDHDRLRFVKVFVYLDNVDLNNGPHVFCEGTHRQRPPELWSNRRLSDAVVASHVPESDRRIVTGLAGTVFMADTHGLHKGMALNSGQRRVFQTEYCSSLFGSKRPLLNPDMLKQSPAMALVEAFPRLFARFVT